MTKCMTQNSNSKPLSLYKEGKKVTVSAIHGGKGARKKLYDLGIVPGVTVQIVQGTYNYPYILQIGGSRVMLGWGMVQKIFVCEKNNG